VYITENGAVQAEHRDSVDDRYSGVIVDRRLQSWGQAASVNTLSDDAVG
jgi:hypothetical protein